MMMMMMHYYKYYNTAVLFVYNIYNYTGTVPVPVLLQQNIFKIFCYYYLCCFFCSSLLLLLSSSFRNDRPSSIRII